VTTVYRFVELANFISVKSPSPVIVCNVSFNVCVCGFHYQLTVVAKVELIASIVAASRSIEG
jgi:hypothetical protein